MNETEVAKNDIQNEKLSGVFSPPPKVEKAGTKLHDILLTIDPLCYAMSHFPVPRFGITTSNMAESLNSTFKKFRHLPIVSTIEGAWTWMEKKILERQESGNCIGDFTKHSHPLIQQNRVIGELFQVERRSKFRFVVKTASGE